MNLDLKDFGCGDESECLENYDPGVVWYIPAELKYGRI